MFIYKNGDVCFDLIFFEGIEEKLYVSFLLKIMIVDFFLNDNFLLCI